MVAIAAVVVLWLWRESVSRRRRNILVVPPPLPPLPPPRVPKPPAPPPFVQVKVEKNRGGKLGGACGAGTTAAGGFHCQIVSSSSKARTYRIRRLKEKGYLSAALDQKIAHVTRSRTHAQPFLDCMRSCMVEPHRAGTVRRTVRPARAGTVRRGARCMGDRRTR